MLVVPIHRGEIFGVVGQTVAAFGCVAALVLVYSGLALAWRRLARPGVVRKVTIPTVLPQADPLLTSWTNRTNIFAMKTVNVHEAKTNFSQPAGAGGKGQRDPLSSVATANPSPTSCRTSFKTGFNRIRCWARSKSNMTPAEAASRG